MVKNAVLRLYRGVSASRLYLGSPIGCKGAYYWPVTVSVFGMLIEMVQVGAVAQLGERCLCKAEVRGSSPLGSILETPVTQRSYSVTGGEIIRLCKVQKRVNPFVLDDCSCHTPKNDTIYISRYLQQRPSNSARMRIAGIEYRHGKYNSSSSYAKHDQYIAEWRAAGCPMYPVPDEPLCR